MVRYRLFVACLAALGYPRPAKLVAPNPQPLRTPAQHEGPHGIDSGPAPRDAVDDFLADMLALKKELNAVGNNFNQSVHKLHMLDHLPEFRAWAMKNEQDIGTRAE